MSVRRSRDSPKPTDDCTLYFEVPRSTLLGLVKRPFDRAHYSSLAKGFKIGVYLITLTVDCNVFNAAQYSKQQKLRFVL
jgi:hypothetical protein